MQTISAYTIQILDSAKVVFHFSELFIGTIVTWICLRNSFPVMRKNLHIFRNDLLIILPFGIEIYIGKRDQSGIGALPCGKIRRRNSHRRIKSAAAVCQPHGNGGTGFISNRYRLLLLGFTNFRSTNKCITSLPQ